MQSLRHLLTRGRDGLDDLVKEYNSGYKVVIAHPRHIPYLSEHIRKEDLLEVSCFNHTPAEAFKLALEQDEATFTILTPEGIPFGMFGAGKWDDEVYIWMLGTEDVRKHAMAFMKHSREWVWGFVGIYEKVCNYVHSENKLALKWLEWCGAEFTTQVEINGELFFKFEIMKDNYV